MVDSFVTSLHTIIPEIRLERYRQDPPNDLHMLTNYFWNIALSEALYPTLHAVEIALRNTIHTTLTNRYQTNEWWDRPYTLHTNQWNQLDRKRQDYLRDHGVPITPDLLIAELNFGFWVIILSGPHVARLWRWKHFQLVDQAFPYRSGTMLHDIHLRFNAIRRLRNRVMHHECIFDRQDLRRDHADIHEAIQWISPDLHVGIHAVDNFHEVYDLGWERAYSKFHRMLGGP